MKGVKFDFSDGVCGAMQLWHNFDKSPTEQLISRRTPSLVSSIKEHLEST